jgi:hypothetical protein
VWAEPETGGEAYIPLAQSKRARSMAIWRETGRRLGAPEATYFANGGLNQMSIPTATDDGGFPARMAKWYADFEKAVNSRATNKLNSLMSTLGGASYGGSGDMWVHGNGLAGLNLAFFNRMHQMAMALRQPISVSSGFRSYAVAAGPVRPLSGRHRQPRRQARQFEPREGPGGRHRPRAWHVRRPRWVVRAEVPDPVGGMAHRAHRRWARWRDLLGWRVELLGGSVRDMINQAASGARLGWPARRLSTTSSERVGIQRSPRRTRAAPPTGLFQMLTARPGTPLPQMIQHGLDYIAQRYGNPANACGSGRPIAGTGRRHPPGATGRTCRTSPAAGSSTASVLKFLAAATQLGSGKKSLAIQAMQRAYGMSSPAADGLWDYDTTDWMVGHDPHHRLPRPGRPLPAGEAEAGR